MNLLHVRTATVTVWLVRPTLALLLLSSGVSVAHLQPNSASASATRGGVMLQSAGSDSSKQLAGDPLPVGWGDLVQTADDGEAALDDGGPLAVRIFRQSQAQVFGGSGPSAPTADTNDPAVLRIGGGAFSVYELLQGATYNTVSADPDAGTPVIVSTPAASIASTSVTFLLYHDPGSGTTWVIVTDGTATVTAAGRTIDIPAAFLTSVVTGAAPSAPQPASRATVGAVLPTMEDLTNGSLADSDVLAAAQPAPFDAQSQPDMSPSPAPDVTGIQSGEETGLLPALSNLGGLIPFPSTATLRAGKTTVWYWPHRQGSLDTVSQDDTRLVSAGDGVNVSNDGRADLSFPDFSVQIFRHSQLQMIPTVDPNGYGLGYDLLQGATLNTVSASALQQLSNNRVGVRAGWAVVSAVYTAHPTADTQFVQPGELRAAQSAAPGDAQFLVAYDGTTTWVVVTEGTVRVEPVPAMPGGIPAGAPPAAPVLVSAGSQTWVEPAQAPAPPIPATRLAIGAQFPTIDDLTAGELADAQVLAGSAVKPVDTAPALVARPVEQPTNIQSVTLSGNNFYAFSACENGALVTGPGMATYHVSSNESVFDVSVSYTATASDGSAIYQVTGGGSGSGEAQIETENPRFAGLEFVSITDTINYQTTTPGRSFVFVVVDRVYFDPNGYPRGDTYDLDVKGASSRCL